MMAKLTIPFGLWFLSACGRASLEVPADAAAATAARLERMTSSSEVPGIQYVVVDETGPILDVAAGVRDAATREPMTRGTMQMAYSMTKVVTAIAVLQLVGEGKMRLDAPLSSYYAAHPYGPAVTIRTLLAQTAGVPNPMPLDWLSVEGAPLDRDHELERRLKQNATLANEPGRRFRYSNLSYWLLEKAVEGASGLDFGAYAATRIFRPAGVDDDDARFDLAPPDRSATGHAARYSLTNLVVAWMTPTRYWLGAEGGWVRTARVVPHGRGYGGLYTHASALGRVLADLVRPEPKLMTASTRRLMFTEQTDSDEEPVGMTLGWVVGELDGEPYFGKQGGGLGFHGNLRVYPRLGLATVMMANGTELSAGPIDARSDELDAAFVATRRVAARPPAAGETAMAGPRAAPVERALLDHHAR